jgi:lysophospholipase L1-like esterase
MGTANGYSYSTVPGIRDAQKRAAERAGCAFWDLYEIMGAKNSVFKWARQRPSLMAPDLAHFSNAGQKLIGNLLYKALMIEYQEYKERIAELPKQAMK